MINKFLVQIFFVMVAFSMLGCLDEKVEDSKAELSSQIPTLPINHPAPIQDSPGGVVVANGAEVSPVSLGSRKYVRSVFEDIFLTPSTSYVLSPILDSYLGSETPDGVSNKANFTYMGLFGGPCDRYDVAGAGSKACGFSNSNMALPLIVSGGASREAIRLKICAEILDSDILLSAGLARALLTTSSAINPVNLQSVFELFYPGENMSASVLQSLQSLDFEMKNNSETALSRWRSIYMSLCRSAEWQEL